MDPRLYIRETLLSVFPDCGICRLSDLSHFLPSRKKSLLPSDGSVLVVVIPYFDGWHSERNVSLYALADDYHVFVQELLLICTEKLKESFPGHSFLPLCDSSPIPEIEAACLAGLGGKGKNQLLLHPVFGSFVFLAEIVTDLQLEPDRPVKNPCINCGQCLSACPSNALHLDTFCKEKCLSHITQSKNLSCDDLECFKKSKLIWGCDECQTVCPINQAVPLSPFPHFANTVNAVITQQNCSVLIQRKGWGWRGADIIVRNLNLMEKQP